MTAPPGRLRRRNAPGYEGWFDGNGRMARLLPRHPAVARFEARVLEEWNHIAELVEEARRKEAKRQPGDMD